MSDEPSGASAEVTAAVETIHQAAAAADVVQSIREPKPNVVVVRAVNGIIMITGIALVGAIALLAQDKSPPDGIIAIASGGSGALATMLTVRGLGDRS